MDNQDFNIKEGSIAFWIVAGKVQFSNSRRVCLYKVNLQDGSISIVKDSDNKLRFSHVYFGKGHTAAEYDVSSLDPKQNHMVAVTWSLKNKEIIMYIDGKQVTKAQTEYED